MSFLRSRSNPRGGPDGGNGGKGADVCLLADASLNTLVDYRFTRKFKGTQGQSGGRSGRAGADGKTLMLSVPCGTRALDEDKTSVLAEVTKDKQTSLIYPGGRGGLGNACFKSSTNRRPRQTTCPQQGFSGWVWLQMQLVADVGLIGLPNAGKSSFLCAVSRATPKVAHYPFTTLYPHLGMVFYHYKEAVFEDIPGIIHGASQGKGLGDRFLMHAKKCRVFLHIVSLEENDVCQAYQTVRQELLAYDASFSQKKHMVVLTKSDLFSSQDISEKCQAFANMGMQVFVVSSVTKRGVKEVVECVFSELLAD